MTMLAGGPDGAETVGYLLSEVAAGLGDWAAPVLAALSMLRHVDDDIVAAAVGRRVPASDLLADLPLVQRADDGSFQLHDLWRQTLATPSLDPAAATVLAAIAEHSLGRGDVVLAARQFASAGERDGLARSAMELLARPLTSISAVEMRGIHGLCAEMLGDDPVTSMLDASIVNTGDERLSSEAFEAAAKEALAAGNADVEALALQNAMNMRSILDPATIPDWLIERAEALAADGDERGGLVVASARSHKARLAGDVDEAAALLEALSTSRAPMAAAAQAFGYGDLGRPEDVATPPDDGDATNQAAQPGGQYLAQAIWLRGDISPEIALELGSQLASAADDYQMAHVQVSTNSVLAIVAVSLATLGLEYDYHRRWTQYPVVLLTAQVPLLTAILAYAFWRALRRGRELAPFLITLGLFALTFLGLCISMFPYVVPRTLTIHDAAAPESSLVFMLVGAVVLIPVILAYTAWAYWVFRGKVGQEGYH